MKRYRVPFPVYVAAHIHAQAGKVVDENFLKEKQEHFRGLCRQFPDLFTRISYEYAEPTGRPQDEVEIELSSSGLRRVLGDVEGLVKKRLAAITEIVLDAVRTNETSVQNIISLFQYWMKDRTVVRVIGEGRALLAASLPANRLAHGGASVWIFGDRSPLPNSKLGGGIISISASGKTQAVLEIMKTAQRRNRERGVRGHSDIVVVGMSDAKADEFRSLCTNGYFIGINPEDHEKHVVLRALADLKEYAISELFDALVVAAGYEIGVNFRTGHEDWLTGPWHQHS